MSDLIRRTDVIDLLEQHRQSILIGSAGYTDANEITDTIEALKTILSSPLTIKSVQQWIPCSERLPEKRDWYLAVFKEPDTGFIGLPYIADYLMGNHTAYTTKDGWIIKDCTDRNDCESLYHKNLECVAWMPLPEPYKGE